ncbi:ankyrin repeat-containing domain protein [Aspergillus cavernicola]|uniref:Ankyrin repeat-containing domain protein n=1 Tax=Aspergillus cavernicola TaxID=176166 RepID=A0ABR4IRN2_9EURO
MVVLMLDAGVDVQFPCVPYENAREMPLFVAVNNSCVDVMKELLRRGANPNSYASVLMKGSRRTTYPLHCAVKMTNLKAVDILLQNRAAVNTRDGFGKTPLEIAGQVALDNPQLSNNLLEIIRLLRRKGGIMGTWMRFKLKGLKRSSRDSILSALGSEISN